MYMVGISETNEENDKWSNQSNAMNKMGLIAITAMNDIYAANGVGGKFYFRYVLHLYILR